VALHSRDETTSGNMILGTTELR